jgi:hypothetical protein
LVELVPARLRCSVFSIGYNAGVGVFGGATPMLAVYTIKRTHDDLSPSVLLMAAAVVSIAIILGLRESYRMALPGVPEQSRAGGLRLRLAAFHASGSAGTLQLCSGR